MCIVIGTDMGIDMRVDMQTDTHIDKWYACMDVCSETHIDMCMDTNSMSTCGYE